MIYTSETTFLLLITLKISVFDFFRVYGCKGLDSIVYVKTGKNKNILGGKYEKNTFRSFRMCSIY